MSNVFDLISQRLKRGEKSSKMNALAKQSADGQLSSFHGIFSVSELSKAEKDYLESLLNEYSAGTSNIPSDLHSLISITSEVKAINNQAVILHGERIQRAQKILKAYRDGAFTAWLKVTYGNRQTPYNFLQYYEFCEAMPKALKPLIEAMPRQAVYTLASRDGELPEKQKIVEKYAGETKEELITMIRETFPLAIEDKRRQDPAANALQALHRLLNQLAREPLSMSKEQKQVALDLLSSIRKTIEKA